MSLFLQEFNVKAHPVSKPHFVGRFLQGLPSLSRKKSGDPKWTMQREGLQGRQLTDALRVFFFFMLLVPFMYQLYVRIS